ncbi:hypothetical protein CTAYLR_001872 [Chrysophaeum taylorii]|uniref:Uncharacterized protein n=1 Tax=Chrysophaeum taylorii TaxID=2483200 RepID=A0AAD7UAJ7_9STRA|nr:hypothetical protein CTAYLR_001872 [Chrysophaeum taylorii]
MDPFWLALSHFKRRDYERCASLCEGLLKQQPGDQAALLLQCRARTGQNVEDDTELEEEGVADLMLDENAVSTKPRPGTSTRPTTSSAGGVDRPVSGYLRPGTASRPITAKADVAAALARPTSTARPITSLGRELRLGTASGASQALDGLFNRGRVDATTMAKNQAAAKVGCDYLLRHERNPTAALDLCTAALLEETRTSWWWKYRQGRCYYQLGLYRDAENALSASIREQRMVPAVLELAKVYLRLDQPTAALAVLHAALAESPDNVRLTMWVARVHELVRSVELSVGTYKKVVELDASHVEGLACLAASNFYAGYPEIGLRFYRRLLQMGVAGPEIWTDVGLCCFYSSQFDMALGCLTRALQLADDNPDVWYNIGHVAIGLGDKDFASQAFNIALSLDNTHAESLTNLGVLAIRDHDAASALACFASAQNHAADSSLFQPFFNGALVARKLGNLKDACTLVSKSCEINADHPDSNDLKKELLRIFHIT